MKTLGEKTATGIQILLINVVISMIVLLKLIQIAVLAKEEDLILHLMVLVENS